MDSNITATVILDVQPQIGQYTLYVPKVSLVWSTLNGDALIAEMARVSVLDNKNKPIEKLIKYLADHKHNSPFEMVNMCIELFAPRDITRQVIRHRSFSFQEFSGRYAEYPDSVFVLREPRTQHPSNRQMSIDVSLNTKEDKIRYAHLLEKQVVAINAARDYYHEMLNGGVAKEQARSVLPEGNTLSRMYINGNLRSWIHYLQIRTDISTVQREHAQVAEAIKILFKQEFPTVHKTFFGD